MKQTDFLSWIYGVIVLVILYFIVREIFSVYYTPGVKSLYDSPIVQRLFPGEKNKMFPTWGFTEFGTMKPDSTKYGQGAFWPDSGKGYVPNKFGSGGPDPSGGLRNSENRIPLETAVGWWKGDIYQPIRTINSIYDHETIPEPQTISVGWWGNEI
jgi:hypothetical protein